MHLTSRLTPYGDRIYLTNNTHNLDGCRGGDGIPMSGCSQSQQFSWILFPGRCHLGHVDKTEEPEGVYLEHI